MRDGFGFFRYDLTLYLTAAPDVSPGRLTLLVSPCLQENAEGEGSSIHLLKVSSNFSLEENLTTLRTSSGI